MTPAPCSRHRILTRWTGGQPGPPLARWRAQGTHHHAETGDRNSPFTGSALCGASGLPTGPAGLRAHGRACSSPRRRRGLPGGSALVAASQDRRAKPSPSDSSFCSYRLHPRQRRTSGSARSRSRPMAPPQVSHVPYVPSAMRASAASISPSSRTASGLAPFGGPGLHVSCWPSPASALRLELSRRAASLAVKSIGVPGSALTGGVPVENGGGAAVYDRTRANSAVQRVLHRTFCGASPDG